MCCRRLIESSGRAIFNFLRHPPDIAVIFQELANYGEYSGAPSEQMTYNYAKTILGLMTRVKDDKGKVRKPITCATAAAPQKPRRVRAYVFVLI